MAKILVAEDDHDAGRLLQLMLQQAGHDVRWVETGKAALSACLADPPDVLLLDVTLPEMDGYKVARSLQRDPATAKVVIVFVTGSPETVRRVESTSDILTKPFHRQTLLARVEAALRRKHPPSISCPDEDCHQLCK